MPGMARRRRQPLRGLPIALLLATAGCSSGPSMVLDSDLPAVPGLESVYARNLDRRGGALAGGRIVYRGRVENAAELLDRTLALYRAAGWRVLDRTEARFSAEAKLARGDRRCTITIRSNRIDPAMSQAQLVLGSAASDAAPSS